MSELRDEERVEARGSGDAGRTDPDPAGSERDSGASWSAEPSPPPAAPKPRWGMWLASIALGTAVAAGGWVSSDTFFAEDETQRVADHWLELRGCLLGARLPHGVRPAEQARFIALAQQGSSRHEGWPARCAPYAEDLDRALAAPSFDGRYAELPRAASLVADGDLSARGAELNRLYDALADADLPIAQGAREVPAAPPALRPLLAKGQLTPLGRVEDLTQIGARTDSGRGDTLRLLLPEQPAVLCNLDAADTRSQRWRSTSCRAAGEGLPPSPSLTMAHFAKGAPTLLQVRDDEDDSVSFYDASTGQRLWRTRQLDSQAATTAESQALVLEMDPPDDRGWRKRPRLVKLLPGKRPHRRTLRLKRRAQPALLPGTLLWWQPEEDKAIAVDEVSAQPIGGKGKKRTRALARLPLHSQWIDDCAGAFGHAVLSHNDTQPPRYTVLFHRNGSEAATADAGILNAQVQMHCHDRAVTLLRRHRDTVRLSSCGRGGCRELGSVEVASRPIEAYGTLNEWLVHAWTAPDQPVRLRVGKIGSFDQVEVQLLLDEPERSGLRVAGLRVISADGLALLLMQAEDGQTYALRIDGQRKVMPVAVSR